MNTQLQSPEEEMASSIAPGLAKRLRTAGLHIDYPEGRDGPEVRNGNPAGIGIRGAGDNRAEIEREGEAVDHPAFRKTLDEWGYNIATEGDSIFIVQRDEPDVNVRAWKWMADESD